MYRFSYRNVTHDIFTWQTVQMIYRGLYFPVQSQTGSRKTALCIVLSSSLGYKHDGECRGGMFFISHVDKTVS